MKKLLMIMITIPSLALCQDTNMGVTLTTAQVQKLDDSITGLLPLVPSKYQGVVAGAILLLALASKLGRVYSGWRAGGFMGALRSVFTGSSTAIKLLFVIGLCSFCFVGCSTNPNVVAKRVYGGAGKVYKAGIGENPVTGLYELDAEVGDEAAMVVPTTIILNTNGTVTVVVPDAVLSAEYGAKASFFGSGSSTMTMAVGANAVQTLLGGQHYPINYPYWTNSAIGLTTTLPLASPTTVSSGGTTLSSPIPVAVVVSTNGVTITPPTK